MGELEVTRMGEKEEGWKSCVHEDSNQGEDIQNSYHGTCSHSMKEEEG